MDVYRPYDSIDFIVPVWPTIEAYKKYVGQSFFLLAQKQTRSSYYINNMSPKSKTITSKEIILLSNILKKDKYTPYKKGKLAEIVNKYYTVVNVVNYLDELGKPKKLFSEMKQLDYRTYSYPCKDDGSSTCSSSAEVPCFVLVEQISGDTCYTAFPEKFLMVGAYVKVQRQFQDAQLNYMLRKPNKNERERWRVVKIAIATREFYDYPDYEGLPTVAFIIQNGKGVQKAIPVKEYINMKWWSTDAPALVNDALAKKRAAEDDSKCCTDLVKELEKKYSPAREAQEVKMVVRDPVRESTIASPEDAGKKPKSQSKVRVRRN